MTHDGLYWFNQLLRVPRFVRIKRDLDLIGRKPVPLTAPEFWFAIYQPMKPTRSRVLLSWWTKSITRGHGDAQSRPSSDKRKKNDLHKKHQGSRKSEPSAAARGQ